MYVIYSALKTSAVMIIIKALEAKNVHSSLHSFVFFNAFEFIVFAVNSIMFRTNCMNEKILFSKIV